MASLRVKETLSVFLFRCPREESNAGSFQRLREDHLMTLDCYDFYLWSIGELQLPAHLIPDLTDLFPKEE